MSQEKVSGYMQIINRGRLLETFSSDDELVWGCFKPSCSELICTDIIFIGMQRATVLVVHV